MVGILAPPAGLGSQVKGLSRGLVWPEPPGQDSITTDWTAAARTRGRRRLLYCTYETHTTTLENAAQAPARLSGQEFHQEWSRHAGQSPHGGTQAANPGVSRAKAMPAGSSGELCLPRKCRLKQARDFARARAQGRRLTSGCLILNWCAAAAEQTTRVGVITSRRVGGAVVRNRARRLLREVFRQNQRLLTGSWDIVLVARSQITQLNYQGVERDFLTALRRAGLLKHHEPGAAHSAV